ncbi:DUF6575 domain-containing protein [Pseudomonas sp. CFII68]|uniref:DUF6575 domain-containing protein n=1 Tax=Pseudomonas sp. CFII68 TaxID=911243 RepID=UPI00035538F5|nr:DUF6575 domain-containing protein [Pseudomonas sp. CFII68]EPJ78352.1 hypothetical protein CFII68_23173 [Pseudomonas sp. CFII68]
MKAIQLMHILLEYDYPQVFIARDAIGVRYVCMVSEIIDHEPTFLCVPVSERRAADLCSAKIDLRAIYEHPEISEFYNAKPSDLTQPFELVGAELRVVPMSLLPDEGLIFHHDDEVLNKAQELNSTVAYASLSMPESVSEPRIRTRKLSEFLAIYESVLRNLARFTAKFAGRPIPKGEDPSESHVFGFCHGSFTVQVRSAEACDMLGENKALIAAFAKLNDFLDVAADTDQAVKFLQSVKGHTASSLIGLLNFISENDCQLTNRWSTPGMNSSSQGRIRVATAQNIIQRCRYREDLSLERVDLVGIVDSADVTAKTWKILVDGIAHSGSVKEGSEINLAGIVLSNRYIFRCEEKIEMVLGTGREVKKLSLVSFAPSSPKD